MSTIYRLDEFLYWRDSKNEIERKRLYRFASTDHARRRREDARQRGLDGPNYETLTDVQFSIFLELVKGAKCNETYNVALLKKIVSNPSQAIRRIREKCAKLSGNKVVATINNKSYKLENGIQECDEYGIVTAFVSLNAYRVVTTARKHDQLDFENALPYVKRIKKDLLDIIRKECEQNAQTGDYYFIQLVGEAGTGKSRLALEVAKELYIDGWKTIWANLETEVSISNKLNKSFGNVLIILDDLPFTINKLKKEIMDFIYATRPDGIDKICFICTSRDDRTEMLRALERKYNHIVIGEQYILNSLNQYECERIAFTYASHNYPILDPDLDPEDTWYAMWDEIWATLDGSVDPALHRPLYTMILTDAVCQGLDVSEWTNTKTIQFIIDKENNRIESLLVEANGITNKFVIDDYSNDIKIIRAIATLTGGVSIDSLDAFMGQNAAEIKYCLRKSDYVSSDKVLLPAKPDIIGEFYVAEVLMDEVLVSDDMFNSIMSFVFSNGKENAVYYISQLISDVFTNFEDPDSDYYSDTVRYAVFSVIEYAFREKVFQNFILAYSQFPPGQDLPRCNHNSSKLPSSITAIIEDTAQWAQCLEEKTGRTLSEQTSVIIVEDAAQSVAYAFAKKKAIATVEDDFFRFNGHNLRYSGKLIYGVPEEYVLNQSEYYLAFDYAYDEHDTTLKVYIEVFSV